MTDLTQVLDDCERYWRKTRVPKGVAAEMRTELSTHLHEAVSAGKSVASVVGEDLPLFAEAWAAERRRLGDLGVMSWRRAQQRPRKMWTPGTVAIVATTVVLAIGIANVVERGGDVDNEVWRWVWVGVAVVFGIGEILTAGFFLLPFALGAAAAAVLAWVSIGVGVQWATFLILSVIGLVALRRLSPADGEQAPVGATALLHQRALVLEALRRHETGRVRLETEEWRATTDGEDIAEGTEVVVVEVRGTRLVVEPVRD